MAQKRNSTMKRPFLWWWMRPRISHFSPWKCLLFIFGAYALSPFSQKGWSSFKAYRFYKDWQLRNFWNFSRFVLNCQWHSQSKNISWYLNLSLERNYLIYIRSLWKGEQNFQIYPNAKQEYVHVLLICAFLTIKFWAHLSKFAHL